jgi:non-ribosomal peptide synthetase component F
VLEKQDIPFGQLAQLLKVKRQRQSFPFSVSVFVDFLPDELSKQWKLDNLTITSLPPLKKSLTTKDLGLLLWEKITSSEPSLQFWWCYRKDVFDVETIAQMSEDFQTLLEAIVTAPEQPIVKLIPRRSVRGISG